MREAKRRVTWLASRVRPGAMWFRESHRDYVSHLEHRATPEKRAFVQLESVVDNYLLEIDVELNVIEALKSLQH